jgi:Mrp family chromosome partitioning ATPase/capsular polysaccharide biosynthesis protein
MTTSMNDTSTDAGSIIAPIWKRKWLILAVGILVALGTYFAYKGKAATYTATAQLYLGGEQSGTGGAAKSVAPRVLSNDVGVLNSSIIGEGVRKRLRREGNLAAARAKEKATSAASSAFVTITTKAPTERAAVTLANAYAQAFVRHERANYTRGLRQQLENTTAQLRRLELPPPTTGKGKGSKSSASNPVTVIQESNLETKINNLESQLASFTGVQQVGKAQATAVLSSPKKNAIFGFVLGVVLASMAAFVLSRLDRRLRTLAEVESIFKTQILAALPAVKSPVRRPDGSRAPAPSLLEPLRRLHTTLELGDILARRPDGGPRTILFLSAEAGDGKSTLIANLARVQSEAGARVAVIEADFRRPAQARLLDANGTYGLADVLAGKVSLEEALQPVTSPAHMGVGAGADEPVGAVSTVVESSGMGSVSVLVGGGAVANPPALLASSAMKELLSSIGEDFDYVLIDAPPLLEVSDAMPLLPSVNGIVLVARIGHTRDVSAQRLGQLLGRTASAPLLGSVVNCVPRKDIERYGFAWSSTAGRGRRKVIGR